MDARATRDALRDASVAGDHAGIVALLADDVVLRSPIIRASFEGKESVSRVYRAVLDSVDGFEYVSELGDASGPQMLRFRTRVLGRPLESSVVSEVDEQGRIREVVIFVRPLVAVLAFAAALAPRLATGRWQKFALTVLSRPLLVVVDRTEPLIPRLIGLRR